MEDDNDRTAHVFGVSLTDEQSRRLTEIMHARFGRVGRYRSATVGLLIDEEYESMQRRQQALAAYEEMEAKRREQPGD